MYNRMRWSTWNIYHFLRCCMVIQANAILRLAKMLMLFIELEGLEPTSGLNGLLERL